MRNILNKTRWVPQGYYKVDILDAPKGAEVFFGESATKFLVIAYHGKSNKHDFYYSYGSKEDRAKKVINWLSNLKNHEEMVAKRRAERSAPHTLKVGDILYSSWGYDQTNVNFYQVTNIVGKNSVEIREISSRVYSQESTYDYVVAVKDAFLSPQYEGDKRGETMLKRARPDNSVKVSHSQTAWLWDGKPCYETALGYGH